MVNAMFLSPSLSHDMWGKAIISATYLLDKIPYTSLSMKEIGKSYRIDDEVVQDQRKRDDNDLQDERQYQPNEEEVKPRRSKRERIKKSMAQWKEAIKSEIDSILQNHTWELMDLLLVKMTLAIVVLRNGEVHQMNVKMTSLNGDLEKVLYMNQPEGFMDPGLESKVCRLVKSLYGLRRAPKQ
ncbi:zinc finger, CCHC-type containing protein [Tanacetum coccineum]